MEGPEPTNPALKLMIHRYSKAFTLTSLPDAMTDAADCASRAKGEPFPSSYPPVFGKGYAMAIRFRTRAGEAPVLRTLWTQESGAWRITAYDVELP